MRTHVGYDGWRLDFVRGFHGSHGGRVLGVPAAGGGWVGGVGAFATGACSYKPTAAHFVARVRLSQGLHGGQPARLRGGRVLDLSGVRAGGGGGALAAACAANRAHRLPAPRCCHPWSRYGWDGAPKHNQDAHRQKIVDWINAAGGLATAFDITTKARGRRRQQGTGGAEI